MNILVILLIIVVGAIPSIVVYLSARKKSMLAAQECKMSAAIAKMEKVMYHSMTVDGDVCHDIVYKAMNEIQYSRKYGFSFKKFLKKPTEEQKKLMRKYNEELESSDPQLKEPLEEFFSAYMEASFIKNPLQFLLIMSYMLYKIGELKMLLFVLRCLLSISDSLSGIKPEVREQYVFRSMSEQLT